MNCNDRQIYELIKETCEDHAKSILAHKLLLRMPEGVQGHLPRLIGTPLDKSPSDTLKTWIGETLDFAPRTCLELSLDNWFTLLMTDLLKRVSCAGDKND